MDVSAKVFKTIGVSICKVEAVEEPKKRGRGRQVGDSRGLEMLGISLPALPQPYPYSPAPAPTCFTSYLPCHAPCPLPDLHAKSLALTACACCCPQVPRLWKGKEGTRSRQEVPCK